MNSSPISKPSPLPITFSSAAQADLDREIDCLIGEAGDRVALRYVANLEQTLTLIADFPGIGTRCFFDHPQLSGLRRKPIFGRFASRLVFYLVAEDHIQIVRILDGRQNWPALLRPADLR